MALLAFAVVGCVGRSGTIDFEPYAFLDEEGDTIWGELGRLVVPTLHGRSDGDSIELAVARFAARRPTTGVPIIYLEGGPGAPGIHPERMPLLSRLRDFGDVVTFDQRGSGRSRPRLDCGPSRTLPAAVWPTREALLEAELREARRCAEAVRERGIDLSAYNVLESVEDVDAIRRGLGAERVHLVGISFGSHLGLATLKRHGEHIERAVFAGVEGLDQTLKHPSALDRHLRQISGLIAADPVAAEVLPDFEGLVRRAVQELDREPRRVLVDEDTVLLTGFKFRRLVAGSIVRRRFLRHAPEEFGPIARGDYRSIARVGSSNRLSPFAMRAAMDCGSGASPERWERVRAERARALLQGVVDFPFPEVCEAWEVESLGPRVWERFEHDGPVLFVTGSLDGLTPASNVAELRPRFPAAGHLVIERMGHEGPGLWFASPEVLRVVGDFLMGAHPRDTTVAAPPIDWVLPAAR